MRNKKTTIAGYATILAGVATFIAALINGDADAMTASIVGITGGGGLVAASDGSH